MGQGPNDGQMTQINSSGCNVFILKCDDIKKTTVIIGKMSNIVWEYIVWKYILYGYIKEA